MSLLTRRCTVLAAAAALLALPAQPTTPAQGDPVPALTVHLASPMSLATEQVFEVGGPITPRLGNYYYWFEQGWTMTPFAEHAGSSAIATSLDSTLFDPEALNLVERTALAPAGRVTVREGLAAATGSAKPTRGLTLHLWHAGPHRRGEYLRWRLARAVAVDAMPEDGVLMPAGRTVAGLWDRRQRRYVALSKPFDVPPRRTVEAPLRRPRPGHLDLVVEAARHRDDLDGPTTLWVEDHAGRRPAALVVDTAWLATAFWYDLPEGSRTIRAEAAQTWGRAQLDTKIAPSHGAHRLNMVAFATLDVVLDLTPTTPRDKVAVALLEADGGPTGIEPTTMVDGRRRFERILSGNYGVRVTTPDGPHWSETTIEAGDNFDIVVAPRPFVLRGQVHTNPGETAVSIAMVVDPLRVGWQIDQDLEPDGRFEVVVQQPINAVQVTLGDGSACRVDAAPPIATERTLEVDCR